jgi:uncharacterized membrane protein
MDLRLALCQLAAQHKLDARAARRLEQLAGLEREPARLAYWWPRTVALLAAALGGLGIIFWIAANWETFGRFGRFALLQGFFLVMCAGALWRPAARTPLALAALLAIGALFAYFGQTYQTGADPWQLFALWAVLALPLCLGVRSDVLWAPWSLVAMTGLALWVQAHASHRWNVERSDLLVHAFAWGVALALTGALGAPLRRFTGAGDWALRTALASSAVIITLTALGGLFAQQVAPQYWLALALLGGAAVALSRPAMVEIFGLSVIGLGLNILLVAGLGRALFSAGRVELIGALLFLGAVAAGLLAATVNLIMKLARERHAAGRLA